MDKTGLVIASPPRAKTPFVYLVADLSGSAFPVAFTCCAPATREVPTKSYMFLKPNIMYH